MEFVQKLEAIEGRGRRYIHPGRRESYGEFLVYIDVPSTKYIEKTYEKRTSKVYGLS